MEFIHRRVILHLKGNPPSVDSNSGETHLSNSLPSQNKTWSFAGLKYLSSGSTEKPVSVVAGAAVRVALVRVVDNFGDTNVVIIE